MARDHDDDNIHFGGSEDDVFEFHATDAHDHDHHAVAHPGVGLDGLAIHGVHGVAGLFHADGSAGDHGTEVDGSRFCYALLL